MLRYSVIKLITCFGVFTDPAPFVLERLHPFLFLSGFLGVENVPSFFFKVVNFPRVI